MATALWDVLEQKQLETTPYQKEDAHLQVNKLQKGEK